MWSILKYIGIALLGVGIILLMRIVSGNQQVKEGEYYYSSTVQGSYNAITASLYFLIGVAVGYFSRLNPWLTGIALTTIFFAVAIYEAAKYPGSHNLIPFEFVMYLLFAFPAIMGVYIGRLIYNKRVVEGRR